MFGLVGMSAEASINQNGGTFQISGGKADPSQRADQSKAVASANCQQ
jgi:hypothetical protein